MPSFEGMTAAQCSCNIHIINFPFLYGNPPFHHLIINLTFMAEIQSQQLQQKHGGVQRAKKLSTRVDLTPMVDLGFLLITFFVFTTSLSQPMAMDLKMPADGPPSKVNVHNILTFVLENDTRVGYYFGDDPATMQFTGYGSAGLRDVILQKQASVKKGSGDAGQLVVLIKPTDNASYKNVTQTLDEMLITQVGRYMLLDPTPSETAVAIK
jgi:biopolymer transport protein ExbD